MTAPDEKKDHAREDVIFQRTLVPIPTGELKRGRISLPVHAVIFDIYGTLFISQSGDIGSSHLSHHQENAIAELLSQYKIQKSPSLLFESIINEIRNCHRDLHRKGIPHPEVVIEEIFQTVLKFNDMDRAKAFASAYENILNPVFPMPGMESLLERLHNKGMTLGIISNAQFYTPDLFDHFFKRKIEEFHFHPDLTIFSFAFKRAKPDTHLFSVAKNSLKKMNIAQNHVIYVGNDMKNDILPAKKVGFQTILFAGDRRSLRMRKEDYSENTMQPDMVITSLDQIIDTLFTDPLSVNTRKS